MDFYRPPSGTIVEEIASDMEMLTPKPTSSSVEAGENRDSFFADLPEDAA
jgi:hypothetical protein